MINTLSLFDGISCGRLALDRAGISVDKYFASEIDKYAIQVAQKNWLDNIQLGDVTKIKAADLPKIDLLTGGFCCQSFSFAGNQGNFEDPRGKLFFECVRLLEELKPKYFLFENVKMKKEYQDFISEKLGVEPLLINSSIFTAHDRKRLYWTNIPQSTLPSLSNTVIKDILDEADESLFLKPEIAARFVKTKNYKLNPAKSCVLGKLSNYQGDRIFDTNGKASSLSASGGNNGGGGCNIIFDPQENRLRKLSVNECERLQGVPVNYTSSINSGQAYKTLGNGWTVDAISHLFQGIKLA